MVEKIGNRIIARLKIPKDPHKLISIVPDNWMLDESRLIYPKKDISKGYLYIEYDKKAKWAGFPLENILQNKNIFPREVIFKGDKKEGQSFLIQVRDSLIPSFLSRGYQIDSFTANGMDYETINNMNRKNKQIARLHFYNDALSKWNGVFSCDAEKGKNELEIFKKYFTKNY
jgi:hypothetical protein